MYSVSSNFQMAAEFKNASWLRKLYIGTSDYSDYVLKWPTIKKQWDGVNPQNVTIELSNEGQLFNFLSLTPTEMHSTVAISIGFHYPNLMNWSEGAIYPNWGSNACSISNYALMNESGVSSSAAKITYSGASNMFLSKGAYTVDTAQANHKDLCFRATLHQGTSVFSYQVLWLRTFADVNVAYALFNTNSGTVYSTPLGNSGIKDLGSGWYDCWVSGTFSSDATSGAVMYIDPTGAEGTVDSGHYWGLSKASLNYGLTPTSYFPMTSSGDVTELLTMYSGTIDAARYRGGSVSLTLIDKFRKLADRKIGDGTSSQPYISSDYLIHDMAWYICTSHGGLSATTNSSNPDLNYQSFSSWTSAFSADNVRCGANFTGQTPLEALKKIANMTQSAIYIENNQIKFNRFTLAGSEYITLDSSKILDAEATLDDRQLVNKQWVSAAYNVSSQSFGITVFDASTYSINSYGLREAIAAEEFMWLSDSASAVNLAQRSIVVGRDIKNRYNIKTTIQAALSTIGDTVYYIDPQLNASDTYRIMDEMVDLDSGIKSFTVDQMQYFGAFRLDVSALDSSDVLA